MRINRSIISNQTESVPVVRTLTINGTTYDLTQNRTWTVSGGGVTGSGTTNYLSKWTSGTALGNSLVFDNGTNVGIGNISALSKLHVTGNLLSYSEAANTAALFISANNSYNWQFGINNGSDYVITENGGVNGIGTIRLSMKPGGNLLVNTTTDLGYKVSVNGGIYAKGITADSDGSVGNAIYGYGQVLSGSSTNALVNLDTTWNTTGNANAIELNVTNTASGSTSKVMNLKVDLTSVFTVSKGGAIQTTAPTGYTAKPWKLGDATSGTITPDYYIKVEIDGQIYSIPALLGTP